MAKGMTAVRNVQRATYQVISRARSAAAHDHYGIPFAHELKGSEKDFAPLWEKEFAKARDMIERGE